MLQAFLGHLKSKTHILGSSSVPGLTAVNCPQSSAAGATAGIAGDQIQSHSTLVRINSILNVSYSMLRVTERNVKYSK